MNPLRWFRQGAGRAATVMVAALAAGAAAFWVTGIDRSGSSGGPEAADTLRVLAQPGAVSPSSPAVPSPAPSSPRVLPPTVARDAGVTSSRSAPRGQAPTRLVIPALRARLPVQPTGLDQQGFMALPDSPDVAGWYRYGPAPGSGEGATVIAAHVDTRREGRGPLARLDRLAEGDLIEVVTATDRLRYQVVSVDRLDKSEVDLSDLFSRSGPERVHVVTCGGEFDSAARSYEDNVIAVAVRTEG